ncbi:hypothetical protein, conserved [Angomonas deanei]|uniref:Uncharacterized protein n=1 Tax=Angomonas deanei TaxID=59799 RepID=A0A7G2C0I9_9TRYP|nr:hypothetical protein, conserved [Angomonas deanei]
MNDSVPSAFFAQWIALEAEKSLFQQQVMEGAIERTALQGEVRRLEAVNAELRRANDELMEEHRDFPGRDD